MSDKILCDICEKPTSLEPAMNICSECLNKSEKELNEEKPNDKDVLQ